jgi:hypothetical protein
MDSEKSDDTPTNKDKIVDFFIGFIGWYVVNVTVWFFLSGGRFGELHGERALGVFLTFPANLFILLLLVAIKSTRRIALGVLSALALNFMVSMIISANTSAFCFVPFVFPAQ